MSRPTRERVLAAYRRLVEQRGGEPVGERVFIRETGFSHHVWKGGFWRSWSAFQSDAGFTPNTATEKTPDEVLLRCFAELALESNTLPTEPDLMMKRRQDPSFPSKATYRRWGSRDALLKRVAEYCEAHERFAPVLNLYRSGISSDLDQRIERNQVAGFVYLLRSGKSYKLGRSNAVGRRLRELAIQLPRKPDVVHVIETDDPEGIEQYWHRRFAEKRQEGEWFVLTAENIKAFKRRRYQ